MTTKPIIVLVGGAGEVGQILNEGLQERFSVVTIDKRDKPKPFKGEYVQADASDFEALKEAIPSKTIAIINLMKLAHTFPDVLASPDKIKVMSSIYINASYNILEAASRLHIPKVVFASTNHVTGAYERDGISILNREITVNDMPKPDSVYGAMKLCMEEVGRLFAKTRDISVINLRIGTMSTNEAQILSLSERSHKTILSQNDAISIFTTAIESTIKYGTYYAVSDNPGKPWSIGSTVTVFGFRPETNSEKLCKIYDISIADLH